METALTRRLCVDEEFESVEFPPRSDAHWLDCKRPCLMALATILGIPEDHYLPSSSSHCSPDPDPLLNLSVFDSQLLECTESDTRTAGCCSCRPPPNLTWERLSLQNRIDNFTAQQQQESASLQVAWVDLRKTTGISNDGTFFSSQAEVFHFLRCLLGPSHSASPWVSQEEDRDDNPYDIVCLIVTHPTSLLMDFRVSDAAPSWFCHAMAHLEHLEEYTIKEWWNQRPTILQDNTDMSAVATLLVYKRLPRREWLTPDYPLLLDKESSSSANPQQLPTTTTGCLWETYYPKLNPDEDDKNNPERAKNPSYRLQCPPYLNLAQDYPVIGPALFTSDHLKVFLQEALIIPQWTPWPETQHYSTTLVDNGQGDRPSTKPWTVFPLCHTFPAYDDSKFQWVQQTREICPKTCQILHSVLGSTLRTALFSQLAPCARLEPHTGWSDLANYVVRLHIPLSVPPGMVCGTWVDGCVAYHNVGQPIVFDDSKIHRAFNYHSTQSRIVLIVDLARPTELPMGYATGGHSDELDTFIQQMSDATLSSSV